ncbi:hypothetical protein TNCV_3214391 [Trichonephila clavipes]|nr:hypothetical protein TNCV_3214391 [Trichonephila clavipes]
MTLRKGLNLNEIANFLQEHPEIKTYGGALHCSDLDFVEGIQLNGRDFEESEEQKQTAPSPQTLTNILSSPKKTKSFGKPWESLATMSPIPRYLERAEAVVRFRLITEHDFLGIYFHTGLTWLLTRPVCSAAMPEWMAITCSNALDSMNTRLMTSSVGTLRLGVKWSRIMVKRCINK